MAEEVNRKRRRDNIKIKTWNRKLCKDKFQCYMKCVVKQELVPCVLFLPSTSTENIHKYYANVQT